MIKMFAAAVAVSLSFGCAVQTGAETGARSEEEIATTSAALSALGGPCTSATNCGGGEVCMGPKAWLNGLTGTKIAFIVPSGAPSPVCASLCAVYESSTAMVGINAVAEGGKQNGGNMNTYQGTCINLDPGAGLNYAACMSSGAGNAYKALIAPGNSSGECDLQPGGKDTPGGNCNGYTIPVGYECMGAPLCYQGDTSCTQGGPDNGTWGDFAGYGSYGGAVGGWYAGYGYGGWGG